MKRRGPRFAITAGPSLDNLSRIKVNADRTGPLPIKTEWFEGALTVRFIKFTQLSSYIYFFPLWTFGNRFVHLPLIDSQCRMKDFADYNGDIYRDTETSYFANWTDATWSIQVQGRFLQPTNADDCVFGNTFDKPIRDRLPMGTSIALKAISYIDPSLENDLYADKPWAWSPLLATMNYIRTERLENDNSPLPPWRPTRPVEDCSSLFDGITVDISKPHLRRKYFSSVAHRKAVTLGPMDVINAEFANGFVDFSTLALNVPVVNVSFKLDRLWDGQPVRYVCQSRATGQVYFAVVFQIADLDAENNLEEDDEDENDLQTPEQNEAASRRATRGNSAAIRPPDDLIFIDELGVD